MSIKYKKIESSPNTQLKRADTVFVFDPKTLMNLSDIDKQNLTDIDNYEKIKWFVEVHTLTTGDSFGELGLLKDEPRAATIFCQNDVYLAVLSREDFDKVLKKMENRILN